jgi:hypothetical protein
MAAAAAAGVQCVSRSESAPTMADTIRTNVMEQSMKPGNHKKPQLQHTQHVQSLHLAVLDNDMRVPLSLAVPGNKVQGLTWSLLPAACSSTAIVGITGGGGGGLAPAACPAAAAACGGGGPGTNTTPPGPCMPTTPAPAGSIVITSWG